VISSIPFFQHRTKTFIAFVGALLKPLKFKSGSYLYQTGEQSQHIYFIYNGICGYVLKHYEDVIFAVTDKGDQLGLIDLIPDGDMNEDAQEWST